VKCWDYMKNLLTTTGKAERNKTILLELYILISLSLVTFHFYDNV
jgi:hypothetical protein